MNSDIGQRLYNLRTDNDLLQKHVAARLNISQQYYSEYEKGNRELPVRHLKKLCEFYNVSADYILGYINEYRPLSEK
ncbi:MAG: helix-turn-helix transcriptional regulator [Clostridia bacterium]|nr:helix-turn-helix transcriptional regulator [Clostridia bacterium]